MVVQHLTSVYLQQHRPSRPLVLAGAQQGGVVLNRTADMPLFITPQKMNSDFRTLLGYLGAALKTCRVDCSSQMQPQYIYQPQLKHLFKMQTCFCAPVPTRPSTKCISSTLVLDTVLELMCRVTR